MGMFPLVYLCARPIETPTRRPLETSTTNPHRPSVCGHLRWAFLLDSHYPFAGLLFSGAQLSMGIIRYMGSLALGVAITWVVSRIYNAVWDF